jgi:DNA-binding transcriptional LysR family regulator
VAGNGLPDRDLHECGPISRARQGPIVVCAASSSSPTLVRDGRLRYVLEKFEMEPTPIQVVYPQARLMSNKVRAFVDECVGKLRRINFD